MEDKQFTMSMYTSMEDLLIAKAKYYQNKYEEAESRVRVLKKAVFKVGAERDRLLAAVIDRDALQSRVDMANDLIGYIEDAFKFNRTTMGLVEEKIAAYTEQEKRDG